MTKKMLARKGSKRFRMQLDMTLPAKRRKPSIPLCSRLWRKCGDQPRSRQEDISN